MGAATSYILGGQAPSPEGVEEVGKAPLLQRVWGRAPAETEFCKIRMPKKTSGGMHLTEFEHVHETCKTSVEAFTNLISHKLYGTYVT